MVNAVFRFYEELNDFLPAAKRGRAFEASCAERSTTKHMIEALGVPHTEVELILVNGESVGFDRLLCDGDRVAVYPMFEALDVTPLLRVRPEPLRTPRFAADAHLGALARLLRMAGFDTLFRNDFGDHDLVALAVGEARIILSRDRELLKRRDITHGCFVHALRPVAQWEEVMKRLDLARSARPFSRCLVCNTVLRSVAKAQVSDRLPPSVREHQERFMMCAACDRVYWPGSHWRRMSRLLASLPSGSSDTSR